MARAVGMALVLLGLAGLAWGGLSWSKQNNVDLGPVEMTVTEKKSLPIPPVAGAVAVVAGLVLVFAGGSRRTEP